MQTSTQLGPDQIAMFDLPGTSPVRRPSKKAAARHDRRQVKIDKSDAGTAELKPFEPLNATQATLFAALEHSDQVFAIGPAGTGKTYIAARKAIRKLILGQVERLIIARPTAAKAKHRLGFLPGKADDKIAPWLVPVLDGFKAEVSGATIEKMRKAGSIEFLPFEHMRGRSLSGAVVILDEAQNCDLGDLKLFLTRVGSGTQVIVCGDVDQVDIPDSGLASVLAMIEPCGISAVVVEFSDDDVVRSGIAKQWVKAFRTTAPTIH